MSLYRHITISPYHCTPHHHITISSYQHITISLYSYIPISPYHYITLRTTNHPTTRSVQLNAISARCQERNRTVQALRAWLLPLQVDASQFSPAQTTQCTSSTSACLGWCHVPWIGQDSSKPKGECHKDIWRETLILHTRLTLVADGDNFSVSWTDWSTAVGSHWTVRQVGPKPTWKERTKTSPDRVGNWKEDASLLQPAAQSRYPLLHPVHIPCHSYTPTSRGDVNFLRDIFAPQCCLHSLISHSPCGSTEQRLHRSPCGTKATQLALQFQGTKALFFLF